MGLTYPSNKICPRCGAGGYVWYLDNSEYVAKCTNCDHYFRREDFPMCVLDEAPKPMTNADRIRMMTDKELARFIFIGCDGRKCVETDESESISHQCERCWLDWLKEEAE